MCSSSSLGWIEPFLNRFFSFARFEVIVSREDVAFSKPDPEPYLTLLSKAGLSAADVLVIEDSRARVFAAIAANLRVVQLDRRGDRVAAVPAIADFMQLSRIIRPVPCGPVVGSMLVKRVPPSPKSSSLFRVFLSYDFGDASGHELEHIMRLGRRKRIKIVAVNPGHAASNIASVIREAVASCDGLMAILHKESEWCQAEIAMAFAFSLPVYLLSNHPIKGIATQITSYKIADLSDPSNLRRLVDEALDTLVDEMDRRRGRFAEPPPFGNPVLEYRWESYVELIEEARRKLSVSPADGGFRPTLILGVSRGVSSLLMFYHVF